MNNFILKKTFEALHLLIILGIVIVLLLALYFQLALHELPCPLCLLQRIGFLCMCLGLLMNLRFGYRASHYSIVLLSGLFTSFVALRQVAYHVVTHLDGNTVLDMHLYTWSYIMAIALVTFISLLLGCDRQYLNSSRALWPSLTRAAFIVVVLVTIINMVAVFLECGFAECPGTPVQYELLRQV